MADNSTDFHSCLIAIYITVAGHELFDWNQNATCCFAIRGAVVRLNGWIMMWRPPKPRGP